MKGPIKIGTVGELTFTVAKQHVIDFADETMPAVSCTPWLIWFLEHSAREAMLSVLESHESTVGVTVNVDHLAPTPLGQTVKCQSRVIFVDRGLISFGLRAWDQSELIARGTHKLRVINAARLADRVRNKTGRTA